MPRNRAGGRPALDEPAFRRLLEWLDEGRESHGERYVEIRERLVTYFARRNGPAPDDLADEALNRVARRLQEHGTIDDISPAHYCYIVAKFVLLESLRERKRETAASVDDVRRATAPARPLDEIQAERERTMDCLEHCLAARKPAERELILEYYRSDTAAARVQRRQLAERLGLTSNSLAIRASRLRHQLEDCVSRCRERRQIDGSFVSSE
jgi:RNA polymerase sigma factor (sigma-70 family)